MKEDHPTPTVIQCPKEHCDDHKEGGKPQQEPQHHVPQVMSAPRPSHCDGCPQMSAMTCSANPCRVLTGLALYGHGQTIPYPFRHHLATHDCERIVPMVPDRKDRYMDVAADLLQREWDTRLVNAGPPVAWYHMYVDDASRAIDGSSPATRKIDEADYTTVSFSYESATKKRKVDQVTPEVKEEEVLPAVGLASLPSAPLVSAQAGTKDSASTASSSIKKEKPGAKSKTAVKGRPARTKRN